MDLVNDIFLQDLNTHKNTHQLISCIQKVYESKGDIKVESLCQSIDISIRTLQRWFKEFIGLSPKEYISIVKLQNNIKKIKKVEYLKSQHTPSQYADYSHFYKSFKRYTQLTPSAFYNSSIQHIRSIYDIY
jgi:AraC-like DNA-binding protein